MSGHADPPDRTPRSVRRQIQRIYQRVPVLECKGLCGREADGCCSSSVPLQAAELAEILHVYGRPAESCGLDVDVCPFLDLANGDLPRCSVHSVRPLICRLWGSVDNERMRCPHGCLPRSPLLSSAQADRLIAELMQLSPELRCVDPGLDILMRLAGTMAGEEEETTDASS